MQIVIRAVKDTEVFVMKSGQRRGLQWTPVNVGTSEKQDTSNNHFLARGLASVG